MQPYAQPSMNYTDSPADKNTQSWKNNTQESDKQNDVMWRGLAEDKEFRGAGE